MQAAAAPNSDSRANDFATLQKEYRLMEMNRKAFAEESHQVCLCTMHL